MRRLLDLFCGAGGAAKGYQEAGFYVVGVDLAEQPNYCGDEFWRADATQKDKWPDQWFDAIHASPPCQAYTTMNNRHGSSSPALIAHMRRLFVNDFDLPYVIENVDGARSELRNPIRLTGEQFGLGVHRPRLFETNWMCLSPPKATCQLEPAAVYGKNDGRRLWTRADGSEYRVADLETGSEAMGIGWMSWDELREAVPPAYTRFIGEQLMAHLDWRDAA